MIEDAIDVIVKWLDDHSPWGWRLFVWWQNFNLDRVHERLHAKFIQDGCAAMPKDGWYAWFNGLTQREFIYLMLAGASTDADSEFIEEAIEALSPPEDNDA